jgi:hypothetical protein
MPRTMPGAPIRLFLAATLSLACGVAGAQSLAVRHTEGLLHGFLVVRTLEGAVIASGELSQTARGDRVTSRLAIRFKDESSHEETVVFTQRGRFRLLSDHVVQKGPTFPRAMDLAIDTASGTVRVRQVDEHGKEKAADERMNLPSDLANGLVSTLLKNIPADVGQVTVPVIVAGAKPHFADVTILRDGEDRFTVAGTRRVATRYLIKVKVRGGAGVVATLLDKQPADYHVWILAGEAPVFLRLEGPLYNGGPVWRIELASPVWP